MRNGFKQLGSDKAVHFSGISLGHFNIFSHQRAFEQGYIPVEAYQIEIKIGTQETGFRDVQILYLFIWEIDIPDAFKQQVSPVDPGVAIRPNSLYDTIRR